MLERNDIRPDESCESPFSLAAFEAILAYDDEDEVVDCGGHTIARGGEHTVALSSAPPQSAIYDNSSVLSDTNEVSTIKDAIRVLIRTRITCLLANSLNYHAYLQGQVIERIFDLVFKLLVEVYEHGEQNAQSFFDQNFDNYTKTSKEKVDVRYAEEQIINMIERIIAYKISDKATNTQQESIMIPFVAVRKPVFKLKRRRLVRNVDELERVQRARARQMHTVRKFQPDADILSAKLDTEPDERKKRILKRLKNEGQRYLKKDDPLDGFGLEWDEEQERQQQKPIIKEETPDELFLPADSGTKRARFSTNVETIGANAVENVDVSFDNFSQEIVAQIASIAPISSQSSSIQSSSRARFLNNGNSARRREIRQKLAGYIAAQPVDSRSSHQGQAGFRQNVMRASNLLTSENNVSSKVESTSSTIVTKQRKKGNRLRQKQQVDSNSLKSQQRNIYLNRGDFQESSNSGKSESSNDDYDNGDDHYLHEMRALNTHSNEANFLNEESLSDDYDFYDEHEDSHNTNNRLISTPMASTAEDYDSNQLSDDEISTEDEDDDCNNTSSYNASDAIAMLYNTGYDDFLVGRVIVEPNCYLKSCLKNNYFEQRHIVQKRVRHASKPQIRLYELELDEFSLEKKCSSDPNSVPVLPKFIKFTKPVNLINDDRQVNLLQLPHCDNPVPLTKRSDPRYSSLNILREHYNELRESIEELQSKCKRDRIISRWFICDTLLEQLNDKILRNAVLTRVAFPKLPTWLISKGMQESTFPERIMRVFISVGYDLELLHSHSEYASMIPLEFIHQLYEWFVKHVAKRFYPVRKEDDFYLKQFRVMPILVVINIPQVGKFKSAFEVFNKRIKKYINTLNGREDAKVYGKIELVDWAQIVASCKDQRAMRTNEGRISLLIQELNKDHGLIYC